MDPTEAGALLKKLDRRLDRIEQILPTLPSRDELHAAIAPLVTEERLHAAIALLATKEELHAAIAPLATKEELRAAIAPLATKEEVRAAIAPLASRQELHAAVGKLEARIAEEGERTRRHFDVVAERMHDEVRVIAEGHTALQRRATETDRTLRNHDKRLNKLELSTAGARRAKKR